MPHFTRVNDAIERYKSDCGMYRLNALEQGDCRFFEAWHVPGGGQTAVMLALGDSRAIVERVAELHAQEIIDMATDGPFPLDFRKNAPIKELAARTAAGQAARQEAWAARQAARAAQARPERMTA